MLHVRRLLPFSLPHLLLLFLLRLIAPRLARSLLLLAGAGDEICPSGVLCVSSSFHFSYNLDFGTGSLARAVFALDLLLAPPPCVAHVASRLRLDAWLERWMRQWRRICCR
jgi:hypothetical protein